MTRNLLLGNGINSHFGINDLKEGSIYQRFCNIILQSKSLYESLFEMTINSEELINQLEHSSSHGIETAAATFCFYIIKNRIKHFNRHEENRLRELVKTSALNAIFYKDNSIIDIPNLNTTTIAHINKYDSIFTLNYNEVWDSEHRCIYLHGKYDIPNIDATITSKPILLYDIYRKGHVSSYDSAFQNLKSIYNFLPFNGRDIVFSPLLDKQKVLNDRVVYPGASTFPAPDLFLLNPRTLYDELDNLQSLDIFGMSPFGDEKLINKISTIPYLTIYVYNSDPKEVNEWDKLLQRKCCKDSSLWFEQ